MNLRTDSSAPAISRALAVLDLLAHSKRGLSLSDVSRMLGLPKSSTYRILGALKDEGAVTRDADDRRFRYGLRLLSSSRAALQNISLRDSTRPFLLALRRKTGLAVHLGVLDSGQALIVEKIEGSGLLVVGTWVGHTMDIHSTALGKALAVFLPEEEFDREIKARSFVQHNQKTIVTRSKLKEELARVREVGYSVDDEEDEVGMRCVGSPVFDGRGRVVAAISVVGTTLQIRNEDIPRLGHTVKQIAAAISASLCSQKECHET